MRKFLMLMLCFYGHLLMSFTEVKQSHSEPTLEETQQWITSGDPHLWTRRTEILWG